MIDDGLFQHLTATGTATNALIATRLYPLVLPEDDCVYPAATHQIVSNVEERTLDDNGIPIFVTTRIKFEGWAKHKKQAQAVTAAIRADLVNFKGALPSGDVISNAWIASGPLPRYVQETQLYLFQVDWILVYKPA